MVKHHFLCFLLPFFFTLSLSAQQSPSISAEISGEAYANQAIKGTITITHDKSTPVDQHGFRIGKEPLSVQFVKEVKISPNDPLVLSFYNFTLPGKPEGLYALQAISVKVGDTIVQSTTTTYAVNAGGQASASPSLTPAPVQQPIRAAPSQSSTPDPTLEPVKPSLRLEASVEGKQSLYPGQRTKLVYRYFYSGDIALTTEKLPLLDAEGFIKIGEKEITDSVSGTTSIRTISQVVEAVKPGEYKFTDSLIEGQAYKEDLVGNPLYLSDEKLTSKADPVSITVLPFPLKDQPASFNGAVGQFTFTASLLSPPEIMLGDEFSLAVAITGEGNLNNIRLPDLCCQPGFSGFFRLNDLPPTEVTKDKTKTITAKLRPVSLLAKAVPTIEFSFFDPSISQYITLHSDPIPITVKPNPKYLQDLNRDAQPIKTEKKATEEFERPSAVPPPIDLKHGLLSLDARDLYNKPFGSWWSLLILPLGILLYIYLRHLKDYLIWQKGRVHKSTSQELFQEAVADIKKGKIDFERLNQAFKQVLVEKGILSSPDISDRELPGEGAGKEVKELFAGFDEKRFSGKGTYDAKGIYRASQELMDKLCSG